MTSSPAPRRRRRRTIAATILAVTLLAALTACSDGDDAAESTSTTDGSGPTSDATDLAGPSPDAPAEDAADRTGDEEAATAEGEAASADGDAATPIADLATRGREVVRTAAITLELLEPDDGLDQVRRVAEAAGGFVATADLRRDAPAGDLGGTIVARVPSGGLLGTLDALEDLAEDAPVRSIDERDVGAQAVDLRAQVTNLAAYEAELRDLLTEVREESSDPDRVLRVFDRAQQVRSDIDRLVAQLDDLEDRVALSTITVTIRPAPGSEPLEATAWAPLRTLEEALTTTRSALAAVADAAIWVAVTVVPVGAVAMGVPALAWGVWRRRRTTPVGRAGDDGASAGSPSPARLDG